MIANRILNVVLGILGFVVIPVQIVTTFVLGLAVSLSFGLLLLPISFVWAILLFPMLALSWLCNKAPALRDVLGIIFIPWVVVADTFVALMPSMGELENRASKLMLCNSWPYTWEFWRFLSRKLDLESADPASIALYEVVNRISFNNPLMKRVLMRVSTDRELDPNVTIPRLEQTSEQLPEPDDLQNDTEATIREELTRLRRKLELLRNPETICAFGNASFDGDGVPQDYVSAADWYRIAAERGHAMAQHNLAIMYDEGQGVPQDYVEAAKWFRAAAEQGHPGSQNNLGCLFERGHGVAKDYAQAAEWYRKAAANGDDSVLENLQKIETILKRDEYSRIVFEFADLIADKLPLIGDCAILPHSKKKLLYAVRWMVAHYETGLKATAGEALREQTEAILPTFNFLSTHIARDWHDIDPEDKDAVARLNQCETFPEWALVLKRKYINEDRALEEACDATFQVMVDQVDREKAAR